MADNAARDQNNIPTLLGVSSSDGTTPVKVYADPSTHRLLVSSAGAGSGTVTSVSVVSANGLAGTVANATTTPAITLTTSINAPALAGNGTAISAATTTGSGSTVVLATSPSLTTPTLGAATATSINKMAITAPATSSTLAVADGKTFTVSNTLTLTGTDTSSVAFGGGGTVTYTSNNLSVFAATTSAQLAGVISDETGSGALVFGTAPSFPTTIAVGANGGSTGQVLINGGTSGQAVITTTSAAGSPTVTLPANTGTVATIVKTGIMKISGGATQYGMPGTFFTAQGTTTMNINEVRYVPLFVPYPVTMTSFIFEVSSAPGSNANVAIGIYAADADMQPTGAPLLSTSVAVASGFTGVKTTAVSVPLTPGVYLISANVDVAMTLRTILAPCPGIQAALGATPMIQRTSVAQAYAVPPNPGTKWTAVSGSAGGTQHFTAWQWTE